MRRLCFFLDADRAQYIAGHGPKSGANYMNSQLIKMAANINGFAEGIALDVNSFVGEGSGVNVFVVHREKLITAPLSNSVLPGITATPCCSITIVEQMIRVRCSTSQTNILHRDGSRSDADPFRRQNQC